MTQIDTLEKRENGVALLRMRTEEVDMVVSNLGCHIISIKTKDKYGNFDHICLGYQDVEDCRKDGACLGAIVGRVANRIGKGEFVLNDRTYHVAINNGPNHLHGGIEGFDVKLFDYMVEGDSVVFTYISPDMEEGYPGNLQVKITYTLIQDALKIDFDAISDQDTLVNLTNHAYFNLSGSDPDKKAAFREKIDGHKLKMKAQEIACVNADGLADGPRLQVQGTPFDFNDFHEIGERISEDHVQLKNAGGYDHPYILSENQSWDSVVLYHEGTGRKLSINTSYPVVQIYTGNFLSGGVAGLHGPSYEDRDGVALEAQFMSNSIHIEKDPKVILRAGERYSETTRYKFSLM